MRLALALGVALAALTASAAAQPEEHRVFIAHGMHERDADNDGWITREEALAAADRMFDELDGNQDGRLNEADRESMAQRHRAAPHARMLHGDDCTREEEGEGDQRRVTVTCRVEAGEHGEGHGERVERHVTIMRHGDGDHAAPEAPLPPMPPVPPMAPMFMFGDVSEFDRDGDQALSREEFRAQHMAMFDARDGNRDGRVRAMRMPEPPTPPTPPAPPQPPRRR